MNDTKQRIQSRERIVNLEYEYQNNLKNNDSSLYSNMKSNLFYIIYAIACGCLLYFKFDDLHIIFKIILGICVAGGAMLLLKMIFSKALWIYAFHYILTFCLDTIFFIILLPRKLFGKKYTYKENEEDKAKIYSDIE